MSTPPTTKQQLDAAWDRLRAMVNITMPVYLLRLVNVVNRTKRL